MFTSFKRCLAKLMKQRPAPTRVPPGRVRLAVELLENRLVPTTLHVTSAADPANWSTQPTTLRYCLNQADLHVGYTVEIDTSQPINLTQGELFLDKEMNIDTGPGVTLATISGHSGVNLSRIFEIAPGAQVQLANLYLIDGAGVAHNPQGTKSLDGYGGAILNQGTLVLSDCNLSSNSASIGGGALANFSGTVTLGNSSSVIDNHGTEGGGGIYTDLGTVTLSGTAAAAVRVEGNTANSSYQGGGIDDLVGSVVLNYALVYGNSAGGEGGGIADWVGTVTVVNSEVSQNTAQIGGGGIVVVGAKLSVSNSEFQNDSTTGVAGGGAIYERLTSTVTISGSTFLKDSGGPLGGALYDHGGVLTVSSSTLEQNTAAQGAAIAVDDSGTATVESDTFLNNSASAHNGGALDNSQATLKVGLSHFSGNVFTAVVGPYTNLGGNTGI